MYYSGKASNAVKYISLTRHKTRFVRLFMFYWSTTGQGELLAATA